MYSRYHEVSYLSQKNVISVSCLLRSFQNSVYRTTANHVFATLSTQKKFERVIKTAITFIEDKSVVMIRGHYMIYLENPFIQVLNTNNPPHVCFLGLIYLSYALNSGKRLNISNFMTIHQDLISTELFGLSITNWERIYEVRDQEPQYGNPHPENDLNLRALSILNRILSGESADSKWVQSLQ
jgi:hypothetical protein